MSWIDAFEGKNPRFFNHNIDSLQSELQTYVKMMGKRLKIRNHIDKYTYDLLEPRTEQVYVYGRIYAGYQDEDQTERLTLKNAEIHFHPKFQVPFLKFDFPNGVEPGIFRGEIIAALGTVDAQSFHASKIYTDCRIDNATQLPDELSSRVISASGPYVTDNFELCEELNANIRSYKPDLVIFFGPFAPSNCKLLTATDCEYTAQELTEKVVSLITKDIPNSIVIPAPNDALAVPVIPRPALNLKINANSLGDPTFIKLKDCLNVMAIANDLQQLIGQQYDGPGSKRDEVPKLIAHQCSACPSIDPSVQIQYLQNLVPKETPHLIVVSSKFFNIHNNYDGTNVVYVKQDLREKALSFVIIDIDGNEMKSKVTNEYSK